MLIRVLICIVLAAVVFGALRLFELKTQRGSSKTDAKRA